MNYIYKIKCKEYAKLKPELKKCIDKEMERLMSLIKATEESTRTGAINEQVQTIKSIEKAKIQQQEIQKDVEEQ